MVACFFFSLNFFLPFPYASFPPPPTFLTGAQLRVGVDVQSTNSGLNNPTEAVDSAGKCQSLNPLRKGEDIKVRVETVSTADGQGSISWTFPQFDEHGIMYDPLLSVGSSNPEGQCC